MKKLIVILLFGALTVMAHKAFAQHGDFSDWNVPPPIPPTSTVSKNTGPGKSAAVTVITDVAIPSAPKIGGVKPSASPEEFVLPDVEAPSQPSFPELPFQTPVIPFPQVPEAFALNQRVPQDQQGPELIDLPDPAAPDLPEFPKGSAGTAAKSANATLRIPIVTTMPSQPVVGLNDDIAFPFSGWYIPALPANQPFNFVLPESPADNKPAPKTAHKGKKTHKRK